MEETTLQSRENSLKEPQETLLKLPCTNNTITGCNKVVGDGNVLAYNQRSDISPRMLQTDSPIEGNSPPVQNQLRKWVSQPSPATSCNSVQPPAETALKLKAEAWHQCRI